MILQAIYNLCCAPHPVEHIQPRIRCSVSTVTGIYLPQSRIHPRRHTMVRTSDSGSSTAMDMERDVEGQKTARKRARHWELVFDQVHVTPEVLDYPYKGSGTERDPYVVEFIPDDRRNPMNFTMWKKWTITILLAFVSCPPFLLRFRLLFPEV